MIITHFLVPKKEVVYLTESYTMRQAMEKMERHRYSAVPIIGNDGRYIETLTEGDLLWKWKNTPGITFDDTENIKLGDVPKCQCNNPVNINASIKELLILAKYQNFVPVVDDRGIFIGIARRRDIIDFCVELIDRTNDDILLTKIYTL